MATDPNMAPADDTDADPAMDATQDDAGGPKVLLTVLSNGDGTYQLVEGDEPEPGDGGAEAQASPETGMGASGQGQAFDSPGPLLKAIMDMVKADMDQSSGSGSAEQNFQAGFMGGAAPAKQSSAQKY